MTEIHILLFYKYVEIDNPEKFRERHLRFCLDLGIRGRILVAEEGINGSVSGTEEQTEKYKEYLRKDLRFKEIQFKEDIGIAHPFKKMIVKAKKEIVSFGQKVDLKKTGKYLTAGEFLDIYNNGEIEDGNTIILDARNSYESKVGRFRGAVTPDIKNFREFPKVKKMIEDKKDKKIIMYCTGGIRCEKASAYLKEQGFEKVYQLQGGILTFGKQFPDTIWEGKCFVFDKRMTSQINSEQRAITKCEICSKDCDLYRNCSNNDCDKLCIVCLDCEEKYGGCCSKECFKEMQGDVMTQKEAI